MHNNLNKVIIMRQCYIYPGVENLLVSEHTIISHVATNWHPAAVAKPFTCKITDLAPYTRVMWKVEEHLGHKLY